jgi:hypothetical protein
MASEQIETFEVEQLAVVPLVKDATQPTPLGSPPTGAVVAVVGTPIDGGTPVYDAALGYCVWSVPLTADDFLTESSELVTESGNPLTEIP